MPKQKRKATKKVIKPGKDINDSMVQGLREKILSFIGQGVKEIIMDFNGVVNIDSTGLGLLIAAHNSLSNVGGSLKIKNMHENINKFMQIINIDRHIEIV